MKKIKGTKSNSALLRFLPDKSQIKTFYKIQKLIVSTKDFTEFWIISVKYIFSSKAYKFLSNPIDEAPLLKIWRVIDRIPERRSENSSSSDG